MFDINNFNKVIDLMGHYEAISKGYESVTGFGNISVAQSHLIVRKDSENKYAIILFVVNEWDRRYSALGDYEYIVEQGKVYSEEEDEEEGKFYYNYDPLTPHYYLLGDHFREILHYLKEKTSSSM